MAIWTISLKNVKTMCQNVLFMILMLIMPLALIFFISSIINSTGAPQQEIGGFVEVIILNQAKPISFTQMFSVSMLVQFLLMTGVFTASMIVEEREKRTMMRIFAAPLKKIEILLGNLFGQLFVILILATIIIVVTSIGMDVFWGDSLLNIMIVTLFTVYTASAIAFACSAIFKNPNIVSIIMSIFIITMSMLSGTFNPSGQTGSIGKYTLNKWAFEAYIKVMAGESLNSILTHLLILGVVGTIFMVIACVAYRRDEIYE